nr:MAG: hypothetical protein AmFV_00275 [Apis mellifera filamentous virus]
MRSKKAKKAFVFSSCLYGAIASVCNDFVTRCNGSSVTEPRNAENASPINSLVVDVNVLPINSLVVDVKVFNVFGLFSLDPLW